MQLEKQLQVLEEFGFTLEPGVTLDDLFYSSDREGYEAEPFDLIFFIMGVEIEREPWGRRFCKRIWNFDTECIEQTGDYVKIAQELCNVAGKPQALQAIADFVDVEAGTGWLKYKVGDVERYWDVEVDNDWADPMVVSYVMDDIETDGGRFYGKDNGQASIICYLTKEEAERLNGLSKGSWVPMVPDDLEATAEAAPRPRGGLMASLRNWFG
jgi:hypothetical protein